MSYYETPVHVQTHCYISKLLPENRQSRNKRNKLTAVNKYIILSLHNLEYSPNQLHLNLLVQETHTTCYLNTCNSINKNQVSWCEHSVRPNCIYLRLIYDITVNITARTNKSLIIKYSKQNISITQ